MRFDSLRGGFVFFALKVRMETSQRLRGGDPKPMGSVIKKRRKKIRKHKYKKLRKRMRFKR